MKKCAICDLNYIKDDEEACAVCKPPILEPTARCTVVTNKFNHYSGGMGYSKGKITEIMVATCYKYAKQYFAGQISLLSAAANASAESNMNEVSAQRMIGDSIKGLFEGREYKSVMSERATVWLLEAIRNERGEEKYQTALKAVELHLDYYEQLPRGNAQRKIRGYVDRNKKRI